MAIFVKLLFRNVAVRNLALSAVLANIAFAAPASTPPRDPEDFRATVDKYCVTCHSDRLKTGGLTLEKVDMHKVSQDGDLWEKVIKKLRSAAMPPVGMPRPDASTVDEFAASLERTLDRAAAAQPNPGRPLLHRLNRAEYANAIHDLLALDVDVTSLLPPDDSSHGFDNVADALGMSPALLDRYLSAASKISAVAVGDLKISPGGDTYVTRGDNPQTEHVEGLPLGTRGGLLIRKTFPLDAYYSITAKLFRTNASFLRGMDAPNTLIFTVDDQEVFRTTVGTAAEYAALLNNPAESDAIDAKLHAKVPIKAGPRKIGVTFVSKTAAERPTLLKPLLAAHDPIDGDGLPQIDTVQITGPFDASGPGDTPSRRQIFTCRPVNPREEQGCARTIVSALARRAWRRPVSEAEVKSLLHFYQMGRTDGDFDSGIELALRRLLADPAFVFRAERDPADSEPAKAYRLSDFELASRLSFFLWSTIPDDRLLDAAQSGKLHNPETLAAEVRRMLADPKADALVSNFAGQWLQLRNLKRVAPDPMEFPNFDDTLRQSMQKETELLFSDIMRGDHSVLDLLTANYTFVNERLARHYGIPDIYGTQFRKVPITDDARRGLLGQASILTVTSYPNRTSPVLRGKWILQNLMGSPPPPPPPNVPLLKEAAAGTKPQTMRERMEQHRANAPCSNCHKLFDPLGFAMENFDATGAWRSREGSTPVDASSQLADGQKVDGVVGLREHLLSHPEIFVGTFIENMMTYATGRGLDYYDMPAVRAIVRDSARDNYRFSSLILGVVRSIPFEMRLKSSPDAPPTSIAQR
jgi:hypothetical protein